VPKTLRNTLLAAGLALGCAGLAQAAAPGGLAAYNARAADSWADWLVLCDTTAFLASKPDLNATRMWVRRDDGHSDLLLPPDFVGAGQWYKEDYGRLFRRLKRQDKVDMHRVERARGDLAHAFIEAYRKTGRSAAAQRFLTRQDAACRDTARGVGVIVS
jgi:hypothetical protein